MPPLGVVFGMFVLLLVLRVPVAVALGMCSIVGFLLSPTPIPLSTLPTVMWQAVNSFVLLAIPFFILMGNLALASGVTRRLVDVASAWIGHWPGGLAQVGIVVNIIMAGMSGSDLADAAATGSILIPAMKRAGYPVGYAASVIAGAATIGPMIPPSIAFIIFASVTDVSVGRLFLGGAVPGIVLGLLMMIQAYVTARRRKFPRGARMTGRERVRVTLAGVPVLMIPVVVLGSMLSGVATPTESAVVGVLAVTFLGAVVYRELTPKVLAEATLQTLKTTATIFFIIATASAFARVLTLYGVAGALAEWITGVTSNDPVLFLLGINVLYLLLGCVVDSVPIMLVFVPMLMPTVTVLGIDPVHFGVVTVFNLLIGLITPPYGLTMFLVCQMAGVRLTTFWQYCWPIFLTLVVALVLTTMLPPLTLALPNLIMP